MILVCIETQRLNILGNNIFFFRLNISPMTSLINNENKWPEIKNKLEAKNKIAIA